MCKNVLEDTGRSMGCCFGSVIDDFKQISVLVLMSCQVNLSKKKKLKSVILTKELVMKLLTITAQNSDVILVSLLFNWQKIDLMFQ